jgi:hypothetical protein
VTQALPTEPLVCIYRQLYMLIGIIVYFCVYRRRFFRYRPIRNKNCLWWPWLLTDRDEMSNLHRGHSIYSSCHVRYNSIFLCLQAALRVNQYNVALRLLRKITDRPQLQILNDQQQNLFHVLALHTNTHYKLLSPTPWISTINVIVTQSLYRINVWR